MIPCGIHLAEQLSCQRAELSGERPICGVRGQGDPGTRAQGRLQAAGTCLQVCCEVCCLSAIGPSNPRLLGAEGPAQPGSTRRGDQMTMNHPSSAPFCHTPARRRSSSIAECTSRICRSAVQTTGTTSVSGRMPEGNIRRACAKAVSRLRETHAAALRPRPACGWRSGRDGRRRRAAAPASQFRLRIQLPPCGDGTQNGPSPILVQVRRLELSNPESLKLPFGVAMIKGRLQ